MIDKILESHKKYFYGNNTKSIEGRKNQLLKLKSTISKYQDEIIIALYKDLRKPEFEAYATEVGFILNSISFTVKNLSKWAKNKKVKTPIHQLFSKSFIQYEPYGTVLIIAPFNYPFQLAMEPLIGAIAAGNTAVIKPSEYTLETEKIINKIIKETFEEDFVTVISGGKEVVTELIHGNFDYIFFTGSVPVGRIVMKAAAENLTPITLELGGKSPCIVHSDTDIEIAAKRIVWGKYMNGGQICIAPDYIYVQSSIKEKFIKAVSDKIVEFYGNLPNESGDYCRIINEKQFDRLVDLISREKVVIGGQYDRKDLYIAPTVLKDITWEDKVMEDEIFGPIMPILSYENIEEVIKEINKRPKPLALYIFTNYEEIYSQVIDNISFGGGCINDTISHVASPYLPFGGVGNSGIGSYHGQYTFETFSHKKSILKKSMKFNLKFLYPPYKDNVKIVKKIMK